MSRKEAKESQLAARALVARTQEARTEEAKMRLRQAALELFAADGYEATTLAAISLKAGYSRTLAQYHYAEKAALALELLEERITRDNHAELLDCPDDAPAEKAWGALMSHLDAVTAYYAALHGGTHQSAVVRGEMAIHAAALMATDERIKARVNMLTRDLVARIERLLEICRRQRFIPVTVDVHALAVLHVHSIWGLAQALFASPQGTRQITAALHQIGALLESLRHSHRPGEAEA